jgi:hypothetical protein
VDGCKSDVGHWLKQHAYRPGESFLRWLEVHFEVVQECKVKDS